MFILTIIIMLISTVFGKITGVDLINETFIVSIGTNTSINLLFSHVFGFF